MQYLEKVKYESYSTPPPFPLPVIKNASMRVRENKIRNLFKKKGFSRERERKRVNVSSFFCTTDRLILHTVQYHTFQENAD
jgi:hypothetical protein